MWLMMITAIKYISFYIALNQTLCSKLKLYYIILKSMYKVIFNHMYLRQFDKVILFY